MLNITFTRGVLWCVCLVGPYFILCFFNVLDISFAFPAHTECAYKDQKKPPVWGEENSSHCEELPLIMNAIYNYQISAPRYVKLSPPFETESV